MRPRQTPDGLPFRVYARTGVEKFSIGFKGADGKCLFRLSCPVHDQLQIAHLRKEASLRALPITSFRRPVDSTWKKNESKANRLRAVCEHMPVQDFQRVEA